MVPPRTNLLLVLLLALIPAGGASCPQFLETYTPSTARVLPPSPSLTDVISVVNQNSDRIQSLYTTEATISVPKAPALRADLAFERDRRFRLRAALLGSPAADLGSNDELFWFWIKWNKPPAVYFCHHDRFYTSAARGGLPIEPQWLIEALGVVAFDPQARHQGPRPLGSGRLQIESPLDTPRGRMVKLTVLDEARGWVLEQHLYDQRNQLVASARASRHARDPVTEISLPGVIDIQWPQMQLKMRIELEDVMINHLPSSSARLWAFPDVPGHDAIDLAGTVDRPAGSLPPHAYLHDE